MKAMSDSKNSCYTYFKITGDFDPDQMTDRLGLQPSGSWKIGDRRRDGSIYDFALWEIGRCDEYDGYVVNQMRKTIAPLKDKINMLSQLRNSSDVRFTLQIVPTIHAGTPTPCLAPSLEIIDFCHATRTEIDIDLYIEKED